MLIKRWGSFLLRYPDGTKLTNFYALDGQVRKTSGSRSYAAGYGFDGQGRKTTMTNWTSFPSSGAELTTWNYDAYRGWLTSKLDNSGYGPTYTYTHAGRLASRVWARGTNTSYAYTAAGEQATVIYNDSVTPGVTNTYDRLGRLSTVFCGVTTTTLSYDSANDPLSETNSGGALSTLSITNGYDAYLRRTNNVVFGGGSVLAQTTNSYDAASRVSVVSDGTNTGTYSYLANSPLVDHLTLAHSGTNMMTNQNTYDYVNRLTGKTSALVFDYQYNTAGQRTKLTLIDGSYWLFSYDTLGQVTGGKKYFWDGTPVAGEQNTYTFDTIGNRTQAQAGGDQTGANLRVAGYTNNALNQITSRGVPGDVDVIGLNLATNTVSVNGTNAYQKWEYFREQMATNNTSAAQYVGINVTAAGQTTVSGNVFLAETPESYTYDLDGNLTQDGRWTYTWDGENRLVNQTSLSGAPTASKYELAFTYDYQGRRIQKLVSTNSGSAYVAQSTNLFEYDGWNLAAMVTSNNLLAASFVWGTDLSGSMRGAGGVGGLLCENIVGNGVHFPAYDGNGNVMALVSVTNGTVTANYEHAPFGELLRATGPAAKLNPFLFSTKYYDWESGFYYYGYRYYNPSTGKWLSRDPIGEPGGDNLYGFVNNNAINSCDSDGRELIVAGVNVLVDLTIQISLNVKTGKDWYDISVTSVAIAGAVGLVGIPDPIVGGYEGAEGLVEAGEVTTRMNATRSALALKSKASAIKTLSDRLARQTAERATILANTAKSAGLVAAAEVSKQGAEALMDSAVQGVITMDGCPNLGYTLGNSVNIVQTVTVPLQYWQGPLPTQPPPIVY